MTTVQEQVEGIRSHEAHSHRWSKWGRRIGCLLLAAVPVVALLNVVGQRASSTTKQTPALTLTLHAPSRVRGGLIFQAKFTVQAHQKLDKVDLALGNGWFDGLTLNTNEPSASTEKPGPDGGVDFSLGSLMPGKPYVQYLEFQVNPTSLGSRRQGVTVSSEGTALIHLSHRMIVVP